MKKLEIERRFLLKRVPQGLNPTYDIVQYYGTDILGSFRVRIQRPFGDDDFLSTYYLTRKNKLGKGIAEEDEKEISFEEFATRMPLYQSMITKHRHVIEHEGLKFEIDKFTNLYLVIMEVELTQLDQQFTFPKEVEPWNIIKEITGSKSMSNKKLSIPC